jgi:hypothetical protein
MQNTVARRVARIYKMMQKQVARRVARFAKS